MAVWLRACRSPLRSSGSLRCSIRCAAIRVFKSSNAALTNEIFLRGAEAGECFPGGGVLCRERVAARAGRDAGLSVLPDCQLAGALDRRGGGDRLPFLD